MNKTDLHLGILKQTVKALDGLHQDIVFLGGATISLYITEPDVITIRETYDVDCVVEVSNRMEYEELSKRLRAKKFNEDSESPVNCRFKSGELCLDVMPTDASILGYSNKWYKEGIAQAQTIDFEGYKIQVFTLPHLIASKIVAFKGRGNGNYRESHDIEDIVTLIDGRSKIVDDLKISKDPVNSELKKEFKLFLSNAKFIESLDAHISDRQNIAGRKEIILSRIRDFTS